MNDIDWLERLPTISINPDMAERDDVARMAAELMECNQERDELAKRVKSLENALYLAVDWMAPEGCDCGTDEPSTCALCVSRAALDGGKEGT